MTTLLSLCRAIARRLAADSQKVVLAESCTAGLVAASLARVPGISQFLCGSAVTYRSETKAEWLKIPARMLVSPGAVSDVVARRMARQVLALTPEATVAVSVTGHLGPAAPPGLDGVVYIGTATRRGQRIRTEAQRYQLSSRSRGLRQREAARLVLLRLAEVLRERPPPSPGK